MPYLLYKIYYSGLVEDVLIYLGRTSRLLTDRLRGHFFQNAQQRILSLSEVSRIEYAECKSQADMFLYEIYYINKYKPALNTDDKARDTLSISLPELCWKHYDFTIKPRWIEALSEREIKKCALRKQIKNIDEWMLQYRNVDSHTDAESDERADMANKRKYLVKECSKL